MKMKKYYIHLLMYTLSEDEYKEELIRTRYIIGCSIKPKRSEQAQKFIDYVKENCYKGNQAMTLLQKKFNTKMTSTDLDAWMKETGLSEKECKNEANAASLEAKNPFLESSFTV